MSSKSKQDGKKAEDLGMEFLTQLLNARKHSVTDVLSAVQAAVEFAASKHRQVPTEAPLSVSQVLGLAITRLALSTQPVGGSLRLGVISAAEIEFLTANVGIMSAVLKPYMETLPE